MTRGELRALLMRLEIPPDPGAVLGVWVTGTPGLEVHLSPATFWRVVKRVKPEVTSTMRPDLFFPHRHRFTVDDVEFFTFSTDAVFAPGTITPGYALRLT